MNGPRVGRYEIIATLGRGGMGVVSLGLALGPDDFWQCAVLKSLRPEHARDEDYLAMFADEARLAARLQHPNVVRGLGVEDGPGGRALALEFLEGQTLGSVCERVGHAALPIGAHAFALAEVLAGLHYAHELCDYDGTPLDVVHRDVSPHNVFVTYDGQVKLLDFGIAKAAKNRARTKIGTLKGKLSYMAPEQAAAAFDDRQVVDRRADVYAVGVMLWEALAGRWRARDGAGGEALLAGLLLGEEPSLREANPRVDPGLAAVCERAIAHDPGERFATAHAFRQALLAALAGRGGLADAEALGAIVGRAFAEERRELRELVRRAVEGRAPAGPARPAPLRHDDPSVVPVSRPNAEHALPPFDAAPRAAASPPAPRPGALAGALALAAGGALAVLLGLALRAGAPAEADAPAAPVPAASAPDPAPGRVRLSVAASPAAASLFLDDRPLPTNPFVGAFERDGRPHRLRAVLAGRPPLERDVAFDRDVALALDLDPAPGAATAAPEGSAPPRPVAHGAGRPSPPGRPPKARDGARANPLAIDEAVPF